MALESSSNFFSLAHSSNCALAFLTNGSLRFSGTRAHTRDTAAKLYTPPVASRISLSLGLMSLWKHTKGLPALAIVPASFF